jgi:glycosyltransferase involved in cell wall biosynthesis
MPNEIIICDDASTDNTLNILRIYQDKFPDIIKIYTNHIQLGVVKNFEKAINLCTKELIFLSDQDDIWFPQKTSSILRLFNYYPTIEAISHNLHICAEDKKRSAFTMWDTMGFQHFLTQNYKNKDYLSHAIFFGNMVTGASLCIQRPITPVIFYDHIPHVIHDYQLAIAYLLKDSIYFHNECLGLYRQHEAQQIGAVLDKVIQHTRAIKLYYDFSNPLWNLLYIHKRKENEFIFQYLELLQVPQFKELLNKTIKSTVTNIFYPKNWIKQLKFILNIIHPKARANKIIKIFLSKRFLI